ncbi:hypothetical protein Msp_0953 [Methanosphaera stadtmanae DSM 3091]|uniref:Uncharacterized protein n=1 Tax=Methanosphaera stadtmanae (strain ATCC 43021 / DSM 3091 / JCM 11832 / MCB-3) TaxID=339860 RepID=Q2NFR2_METST|nr:hypothetical protein Msp_0953 [Methanosphaera stadtmanae DSM 3091]
MILFYFAGNLLLISSSVIFQFHYDLILLKMYSEIYIMISIFQFHYDLILLKDIQQILGVDNLFQFHYDLILL